MLHKSDNILIYDAYCYLCSNTVRLILLLDRAKKISFANSDYLNLLSEGLKITDNQSVVFIHKKNIYIKSEALMMICRVLGGGFNILLIFKIIPLRFRDYLYNLISNNRYRLLGKREHCHIFPPKYKDRLVKK